MQFFLLTGQSGSGKTSALHYLEDMGVFCVDNLPPVMSLKFMEIFEQSAKSHQVAAFAVDARSGAFFDAQSLANNMLELQTMGHRVEIIFLTSSDEVLITRYKETRREHPLARENVTLTEAIEEERMMLQPLKEAANYILDTSNMRVKELQKELHRIISTTETVDDRRLNIEVISFGFKRGVPRQADLVFDVRFLPNPFYIPELCRHSGLNPDVRDFVLSHDVTKEFLIRMKDMLTFLLPHYQEEGKRRLVIGIGCTGGAHRSVAIAEAIGQILRDMGYAPEVGHRDVDIEQAHWTESEK